MAPWSKVALWVAACLAIGLSVHRLGRSAPTASPGLAASATSQRASGWAAGDRMVFRVEGRAHSQALDAPAAVDLALDLEVVAVDPRHLRIFVSSVGSAALHLGPQGHDLAPSLRGATALVVLDELGAVSEFRPLPTLAPMAVLLLRDLVSRVPWQVPSVPPGGFVPRREARPRGAVVVTYSRDTDDTLRRLAPGVAHDTLVADEAGRLVALVSRTVEESWAQQTTLRVTRDQWERIEQAPPRPPWPTVPLTGALGDEAEQAREEALEQLIGELTPALLVADLAALDGDADRRPRQGFVVAATAMVLRQPEVIDLLLTAWLEGYLGTRARAVTQDILASAGTARAQGAMLALLDTAQSDAERLRLIAPLAFVRRPTRDTVDQVRRRFRSAPPTSDPRRALAHSLGSLLSAGAPTLGEAYVRAALDDVVSELTIADDELDRAALVAALGNAGAHAELSRLLELTSDPSPTVRADVAYAMRKIPLRAARDAACELMKDPVRDVAVAAVEALGYHPLSDADVACVERLVRGGELPHELEGPLQSLLSKEGQPTSARALLQRLVSTPKN